MKKKGGYFGTGGGLTLPDSLAAGRGEAMPWGKAEAAEKGSGAFSLSPIGSGRSRAEQTQHHEHEYLRRSSFRCGHLEWS